MEKYFERLQQIGVSAITEFRKTDLQHAEMHRSYLEDRRKGSLTEQGYRGLTQALDETRNKKVRAVKDQIAVLQSEYDKAVDERMVLSSAAIDSADVELLKNVPFTPADFDALAEKHRRNPTMCRLLDNYRKEHDIKSNWRFQTPEQRKEIFNNVCWAVEAVAVGQATISATLSQSEDRFVKERVARVVRLVSNAYHKLQGSNPNVLPIPVKDSVSERPKGYTTLL